MTVIRKKAKTKSVTDEAILKRKEAAAKRIWAWLAGHELDEVFHIAVTERPGQKPLVHPESATTEAYIMVDQLADMMALFSFFPHPPEA